MTMLLIFIATLFLAYANGANDNFKGVATLFGSRAASYRQAWPPSRRLPVASPRCSWRRNW